MSMAPSTSSGGTSFLLPFRTSKCKGCLVIHAKYLLSLDTVGGCYLSGDGRSPCDWPRTVRRSDRAVLAKLALVNAPTKWAVCDSDCVHSNACCSGPKP